MARHKPTHPDTPDWTLAPQQETAVDLLASGMTVTDTAAPVEGPLARFTAPDPLLAFLTSL